MTFKGIWQYSYFRIIDSLEVIDIYTYKSSWALTLNRYSRCDMQDRGWLVSLSNSLPFKIWETKRVIKNLTDITVASKILIEKQKNILPYTFKYAWFGGLSSWVNSPGLISVSKYDTSEPRLGRVHNSVAQSFDCYRVMSVVWKSFRICISHLLVNKLLIYAYKM